MSRKRRDWDPLDDLAEASALARRALVEALAAAGDGTALDQFVDPDVLQALRVYVDIASRAARRFRWS
jgi:hypothetical protein